MLVGAGVVDAGAAAAALLRGQLLPENDGLGRPGRPVRRRWDSHDRPLGGEAVRLLTTHVATAEQDAQAAVVAPAP